MLLIKNKGEKNVLMTIFMFYIPCLGGENYNKYNEIKIIKNNIQPVLVKHCVYS